MRRNIFYLLKEFKGANTIIHKSHHFRTITIPPHQLTQLRRKFKILYLTSFDERKCNRDTTTIWHKNDIQHNRVYAWPEFWLGGFLKFTKSLYTKWLIAENDTRKFDYDINKNLAKLGGIQQAEKEIDENVLEIENLVKKIGDLSKVTFKQKTFFCKMKAIILITYSTKN